MEDLHIIEVNPLEKFDVIDFISRKRAICRRLSNRYRIPEYCFEDWYISKNIISISNISELNGDYIIYFKVDYYKNKNIYNDNSAKFYRIFKKEILMSYFELSQSIVDHCIEKMNGHKEDHIKGIENINRKIKSIDNRIAILNKYEREDKRC